MFPFQVVDIGPYHHKDKGKGTRLVEDLRNFQPDVLMLGWCWSQNSDVTLWLWMYFPYMLLHHDLKVITGRKENWDDIAPPPPPIAPGAKQGIPGIQTAKPDKVQMEIIETLGKQLFKALSLILKSCSVAEPAETCLFVWGSAGTGKTLILVEALKIKMSKLLHMDKTVRILATNFGGNSFLEDKFVEKYFVNIENVEVIDLEKYCKKYMKETDYVLEKPCETVNRVITSLSESRNHDFTIILIDEVLPCDEGQPKPEWGDLIVKDNVIWLLGLSPNFLGTHNSAKVEPPKNSSVVCRELVYRHRNCPQIRNIIKTILSNL